MALDGNTIRRMARLDCADYDESGTNGTPTDPAAPDATYDRFIERGYRMYSERVEPRMLSGTLVTLALSDASATTTATNIAEIALVSISDVPLERIEVHEWQALMGEDSTTTGVPTKWAAIRIATDTEANQGKWSILFYPPSDGSYTVNARQRLEPAAIGGTTGTPDVSETGSYIIAKYAAAQVARVIGETPEFVAGILQGVPEEVQSAMGLVALAKLPRIREMERAA